MAKSKTSYATNRATGTPASQVQPQAAASGPVTLSTGTVIDPSTPDGQSILWNAGQAAANPNYKPDSFDAQALVNYVRSLPPAQQQQLTGFNPSLPDGGKSALSTGAQRYNAATADQHISPEEQTGIAVGGYTDTANSYYNRAYQTQLQGVADRQAQIDALGGLNGWVTGSNNELNQGSWNALQGQYAADQQYVGRSYDLAGQLGQMAGAANAYDVQNTGTYQQGLAGLSAYNSGVASNLGNVYQSMATPLQSQVSWQGDLTSQAAQAYADPASIAAQNQALAALGGGMNGAYSYQSQAAQAYADPQAVAAQWDALAQMQDAARGQLDVSSQAALAKASQEATQAQWGAADNLNRIAQGSLDQIAQAQYAQADVNDINGQRATADQLAWLGSAGADVTANSLDGYYDLKRGMMGGFDVDLAGNEGYQQLRGYMNGANRIDPLGIDGMVDLRSAYRDGSLDINFDSMRGVSDLRAAIGGSQDIDLASLQGISDLRDVYGGKLDVGVGQEDPAAYAAQQDALAQYKGLTTPEVTAAERFIYEQARSQQEQDDRNNRAAVQASLRQRGMSGSGAELTQAAAASQQTSQNRLLSDLGAQANAVNRSMEALSGYAGLSSTMNAQANALGISNAQLRAAALNQYSGIAADVAEANQDTRMGALGQYSGLAANVAGQNQQTRLNALNQFTGISTDVAMANADRMYDAANQVAGMNFTNDTNNMNRRYDATQAVVGLNADLALANKQRQVQASSAANSAYAQARQQGFSEDFARLSAVDAMNQFNVQTRVTGAQSAYGAYSDIRGQEFAESYARGQAADTVNTNNMNRRLTAMGMSGDLASTVRSQSFDEAYKRGTAADTASQFNNTMKFNSAVQYGNLASTQRDQSFSEAFQRGTAADQTAQFNRAQSIDVAKFNSLYDQDERNASWNRAQGLAQTQLGASAQNATNLGNSYIAGRNLSTDVYGRNKDVLGALDTASTRENDASKYKTTTTIGWNNTQAGLNSDFYARTAGTTGLALNNSQLGTQAQSDYYRDLAGLSMNDAMSARASTDAAAQREADKSKGLLGTPILSQNGILGLEGVPFL